MDLCTSCIVESIQNDKKFITVTGQFKLANIQLILDLGANSDPNNKKGLSHLCEHIFLELITNHYLNKISDENFKCIAYTDYNYTVFKFVITNTELHINYLIDILKTHINRPNVEIDHFNKCKREVIRECIYRKEDMKKCLKINSFITNEVIDYVPMGTVKGIENLSIKDILNYFKLYASKANLIVFCNPSITNLSENEFILHYSNIIKKTKRGLVTGYSKNKKILNLKNKCNIKIYFKQEKAIYSEREKAIAYLLEIIIGLMISPALDYKMRYQNNIFYRKKIFDPQNFYVILNIRNDNRNILTNIEKIISNNIVEAYITNLELEKAKNIFCKFINQIDTIEENYVYNNIFHYLIHNELKIVTKDQIDWLYNIMKDLNLHDVNRLKKEIYTDNYKIVID